MDASTEEKSIFIGTVVLISNPESAIGVVRYIDDEHQIFGVELTDPMGNSDGILQGQKLFKCRPNYGVFVISQEILRIVSPEELLQKIVVLNRALTKRSIDTKEKDDLIKKLTNEVASLKQHIDTINTMQTMPPLSMNGNMENDENKGHHRRISSQMNGPILHEARIMNSNDNNESNDNGETSRPSRHMSPRIVKSVGPRPIAFDDSIDKQRRAASVSLEARSEEARSRRNSLIEVTALNLSNVQQLYRNHDSNDSSESNKSKSKSKSIGNGNGTGNVNDDNSQRHIRKRSNPDGSDNASITEALRRLKEKEKSQSKLESLRAVEHHASIIKSRNSEYTPEIVIGRPNIMNEMNSIDSDKDSDVEDETEDIMKKIDLSRMLKIGRNTKGSGKRISITAPASPTATYEDMRKKQFSFNDNKNNGNMNNKVSNFQTAKWTRKYTQNFVSKMNDKLDEAMSKYKLRQNGQIVNGRNDASKTSLTMQQSGPYIKYDKSKFLEKRKQKIAYLQSTQMSNSSINYVNHNGNHSNNNNNNNNVNGVNNNKIRSKGNNISVTSQSKRDISYKDNNLYSGGHGRMLHRGSSSAPASPHFSSEELIIDSSPISPMKNLDLNATNNIRSKPPMHSNHSNHSNHSSRSNKGTMTNENNKRSNYGTYQSLRDSSYKHMNHSSHSIHSTHSKHSNLSRESHPSSRRESDNEEETDNKKSNSNGKNGKDNNEQSDVMTNNVTNNINNVSGNNENSNNGNITSSNRRPHGRILRRFKIHQRRRNSNGATTINREENIDNSNNEIEKNEIENKMQDNSNGNINNNNNNNSNVNKNIRPQIMNGTPRRGAGPDTPAIGADGGVDNLDLLDVPDIPASHEAEEELLSISGMDIRKDNVDIEIDSESRDSREDDIESSVSTNDNGNNNGNYINNNNNHNNNNNNMTMNGNMNGVKKMNNDNVSNGMNGMNGVNMNGNEMKDEKEYDNEIDSPDWRQERYASGKRGSVTNANEMSDVQSNDPYTHSPYQQYRQDRRDRNTRRSYDRL